MNDPTIYNGIIDGNTFIPSIESFMEQEAAEEASRNQPQERPESVSGQTLPSIPETVRQETAKVLPEAPPLAQRTAKPGTEPARNVLQPLFDGLQKLRDSIVKAFTPNTKLPESLRMAMPPTGSPFNLDTKCLQAKLPAGMSVEQFRIQLQSKINSTLSD